LSGSKSERKWLNGSKREIERDLVRKEMVEKELESSRKGVRDCGREV
jgi:hypothetical protein